MSKAEVISIKLNQSPLSTLLLSLEKRLGTQKIGNLKNLSSKINMQNIKRNFTGKKLPRIIIPVVIVLLTVALVTAFFKTPSNNSTVAGTQSDGRFEVKAPLAVVDINKDFQFPVVDDKGKEIGKFTYTLLSAEIKDEIIAKGKRATAVKGRLFLIVNLKISNNLDKNLQVNSRDYIRLTVNGNDTEKIAPDVHNDPIDAQAISTKTTRVGFAINDTDKDFVLQIGEIKGTKESIPLTFK